MQEDRPETTDANDGSWRFNSEEQDDVSSSYDQQAVAPITWSASEFVAHEKDFKWFALLGVGTAMLMFITFLVTRDYLSTAVLLIVVVLFGIFAVRQPRVLQYTVDSHGVQIGEKYYSYDLFKSFFLVQEGGIRSIQLLPMKRFMPPISIYMAPDDEELILSALSAYLPVEQREQDLLDRLMRHLRF